MHRTSIYHSLLYQKQELLTLHDYMGSPSFSLVVFTNTWVHHRSAWWCSRVHGFTLVQLGGVHEYMGSPSFSLVVFTSTWVHPRSAWWCSRVHGFTVVQLGGVCVALFCFLRCVFALYVSCLPLRCSLTFIYTYVNVTKRHPTILINKR